MISFLIPEQEKQKKKHILLSCRARASLIREEIVSVSFIAVSLVPRSLPGTQQVCSKY